MKQLRIRVKGRVQGVWFRASTREQALQLRLKGYVMNMPNGDVFIEVQGETEVLDQFIEWVKTGPQLAKVTELEIAEVEPGNLGIFEIRR